MRLSFVYFVYISVYIREHLRYIIKLFIKIPIQSLKNSQAALILKLF